MEDLLVTVAWSAIAGAGYGLVGYFKNKKQENLFEGFDINTFIPTIVGSAVIGGGAAYSGVTYDVMSASMFGVVVYQFLRKAVKAIF